MRYAARTQRCANELGVTLTGDWFRDANMVLDRLTECVDRIADQVGHPRFELFFAAQNGKHDN
jgi:hypothetical protein